LIAKISIRILKSSTTHGAFTESLAFNAALGYRFEQSKQKEKGLNGTDRKSISTYHRISWNFGFTFIL